MLAENCWKNALKWRKNASGNREHLCWNIEKTRLRIEKKSISNIEFCYRKITLQHNENSYILPTITVTLTLNLWNAHAFRYFHQKGRKSSTKSIYFRIYSPVAPVKRVLINSLLLVKIVSHDAHENNFTPFIWSKNMRPILLVFLFFFLVRVAVCCSGYFDMWIVAKTRFVIFE